MPKKTHVEQGPMLLVKAFRVLYLLVGSLCLVNLIGCMNINNLEVEKHSEKDWAVTCKDWDDWDKMGPPFKIYGNSYYVGTCGIASILITGKSGHILIDGGTEAGAKLVAKNIKALGFSINDVKILLHSHEHFDHVAGLADLQSLSGAKLLASSQAALVLRTGVAIDIDPQAGMHNPFPASRVDGIVMNGKKVVLDDLSLTPLATPGHTPGALTWQWQSCENKQCVYIVYADSLSPISHDTYHFSDHPDYVNAYQEGLNQLAELNCDILVTPHPSASDMRKRLSGTNGLINPQGCRMYANKIKQRLSQRLAKEIKLLTQ
ncbi:subclass B3 metallo-beta-lactamase [Pleionea sediminis]|uniref:subclass B3 metallo-beta-lactamase n=1 Tax=Pleionea sediminis TaxID=2569479 RepID=UPI00197CAD9D|nr:subclass B3 metallo-beta-lactamase [Pleionea sediminis]